MIDYEKLRLAHELSVKYSKEKKETSIIEHYYFAFSDSDYFQWRSYSNELFKFRDIDELITKLKELTQPQPKYKPYQLVFTLGCDEIDSFEIDKIINKPECFYYTKIGGRDDSYNGNYSAKYREDCLYPSREACIRSQIEYWQVLLADEKLDGER